jgi:hypothetical protein
MQEEPQTGELLPTPTVEEVERTLEKEMAGASIFLPNHTTDTTLSEGSRPCLEQKDMVYASKYGTGHNPWRLITHLMCLLRP